MVRLVPRHRIDFLVDKPLFRRVRDAIVAAGVENYLVFPVLAGDDERGRWEDDQVTGGAGSKIVISVTVDPDRTAGLLDELQPMLADYGLTATVSSVEQME